MSPEKKYAQSRFILYTVMIGAFLSMFDSGVVNVGLPVIAGQFRADIHAVQWIASIYLLVMSALLPILGTVADHFGRRRVYNLGFFVISIFTLLCGLAPNLTTLIGTRILQAVGGAMAMVMANGLAIVTEHYPPSERGRNIGLLVTMMAIGSIAGPPLGGLAIGLWGWRSVFYLTFVVSMAGFIASWFSLPRDTKARETGYRFDIAGSLLLILWIVTFIYGFSNLPVLGLRDPLIGGSIAIFAVSFALFIIQERRKVHPVVHLSLFGNWVFTTSIIASLLSFVTMFAPAVLLPFYYQNVLGISPQGAGLYMMAFPVAMAVVSPLSGALSDRIGSVSLFTALQGPYSLHEGAAFLHSVKYVYYLAAGLSFVGAAVSAVRNQRIQRTEVSK